MAAFKAYVEEGRGGWVGLHHATLLGNFDGQPMWPWFSDFMGTIKFKNYIPKFSSGTVRVEDKSHPCMKGVPESFSISREEWYTYDRSPRANVHVLANVDETTYSDASAVRMGDHPVIWTNERMAARNVYIFMGHGPWLFENKPFTTIFRNAIVWAADKQPLSKSGSGIRGKRCPFRKSLEPRGALVMTVWRLTASALTATQWTGPRANAKSCGYWPTTKESKFTPWPQTTILAARRQKCARRRSPT
jgi:type 1 glutamine amidotransferase